MQPARRMPSCPTKENHGDRNLLPVADLPRSVAFFKQLGYAFNPHRRERHLQNIYVMLLVEAFFQTFTPKAVCDAHTQTEVLLCLSMDSRAEVDRMVRRAVAAGGKTYNEAKDHGFMYQHLGTGVHGSDRRAAAGRLRRPQASISAARITTASARLTATQPRIGAMAAPAAGQSCAATARASRRNST